MSDVPSPPDSTSPSMPPAPGSPPPPPPPPMSPGVPGAAMHPMGALGPVGSPRSTGLTIVLTIVTLGLWAWVWSYQNGRELKEHARTGLGGAAYLVITIFLSPLTMFLMASEVEQLYRREGKEPPITTIWGLWFLLPLIGNVIWYVRIQRSLNDYWTSHGAVASSGV